MKAILSSKIVLVIFLLINLKCFGQNINDSNSQIHFFRSLYFLGIGDAFVLRLWTTVYVNDSVMIRVKQKEVQSLVLKSGNYKIRLRSDKVGKTYFLESGKSYYFKITTLGCLIPYFILSEEDENFARKRTQQNNYKTTPKRITILKNNT